MRLSFAWFASWLIPLASNSWVGVATVANRGWLVLCLLLLSNAALIAQEELSESLAPNVQFEAATQRALAQIARAEKLMLDQQWADALAALRRTEEHDPTGLIAVAKQPAALPFATFVPLREACRRLLSDWSRKHPELLQVYRRQIDHEVAALFNTAQSQRDATALERLMNRYWASSMGDNAALLWGDAALARGDFNLARAAWEPLLPGMRQASSPGPDMVAGTARYFAERNIPASETWSSGVHPDADIPAADLLARLVLVSIFEGHTRRAAWELERFQKSHPEQMGELGGRRGNYGELLESLLAEQHLPTPAMNRTWPTFAGSLHRSTILGENLEINGGPAWSVELPVVSGELDSLNTNRLRVAEAKEGLLAYHPLIVNSQVIVAHTGGVRAYEMSTGKLGWEVRLHSGEAGPPLTQQRVGVPRLTLSSAEGLLAIALPVPLVPVHRAATVRKEALSRLMVIDLASRKVVFEAMAEHAACVFAGSPLIHAGRLYAAERQFTEAHTEAFVSCYEISSGERLWRKSICSADTLGHGRHEEYPAGLLTLEEERLYVNTNMGLVAALNANDGAVQWLTRYPRAAFATPRPDRTDRHVFRDLTPCLSQHGQIFCAPADCERIFSLDANTGDLQWATSPGIAVDAVHLLGVTQEHLVASGDYLYWIDRVSGQLAKQFPPAQPAGKGQAMPTPHGWGRGLITATEVYWPTAEAIQVYSLTPQKGALHQPRLVRSIDLKSSGFTGGNLVFAQGKLVLATAERLVLFSK